MAAQFYRIVLKNKPASNLVPKRMLKGPQTGCSIFLVMPEIIYIAALGMASPILNFFGVKVSLILS